MDVKDDFVKIEKTSMEVEVHNFWIGQILSLRKAYICPHYIQLIQIRLIPISDKFWLICFTQICPIVQIPHALFRESLKYCIRGEIEPNGFWVFSPTKYVLLILTYGKYNSNRTFTFAFLQIGQLSPPRIGFTHIYHFSISS